MGLKEKTVFISYRRANVPWALAIYQDLTAHGFDAFFDYLSLSSGDFEKVILENIKSRAHFIVILTPSALERCKEPGDILRKEIETAIEERRNIVPLMMEGFDFGSPATREALSGKLAALSKYNGLRLPADYFFEAMERLRGQHLNAALSDIHLPDLPPEVKEVTVTTQAAAAEAPQVQVEELTAQEWYERGLLASSLDEKIRCYTEAITLQPDFAMAYNNRGLTRYGKIDLEGALSDYDQAIALRPGYSGAYVNRGNVRSDKGDLEGALADYDQAIQFQPDLVLAYNNRGYSRRVLGDLEAARQDYQKVTELAPRNFIARSSLTGLLRKLGREAEAQEQETLARELIGTANEYNQACFESICGNADRALELLKITLKKWPGRKIWAAQNPDFDSLRGDPRFEELLK